MQARMLLETRGAIHLMLLLVLETRNNCALSEDPPLRFHSILGATEAREPLDNTILVKMNNYLPVRNRLDRPLVLCRQHQCDAIGKVRKAPTQYRSV